jgi:F0F1-type ATP synthase assembly protein I
MTACSHREIRVRVPRWRRSADESSGPDEDGVDARMAMNRDGPGWGDLLGLGFSIAGLVIVWTGLGWFVDFRLHTSPTYVLVGVALGIISAALYTYTQFRKFLHK